MSLIINGKFTVEHRRMVVLFFSGSHHSYVVFPITEPLSVSTVLSIFWTECFSWHLRPESKWVFRNIVRKADTRQSLKILMFTALEVFKEVFQSQHQMMTYHKFIPEAFLVLVWVYFGKKIQEEICDFLFRHCAKAISHCVHWIKCPI